MSEKLKCIIGCAVAIAVIIYMILDYEAYREVLCDKSKNLCVIQKATVFEKLRHEVKTVEEFPLFNIQDCYCEKVVHRTSCRSSHSRKCHNKTKVEYIAQFKIGYGNNKSIKIKSFGKSAKCENVRTEIMNNLRNIPNEGQYSIYKKGKI